MSRILAGILVVALGLAAFSGSALAITPKLPVEASLTTVPPSVSWPDSRKFEYRVDVTAGPGGSDFEFTTPTPPWGLSGTYGSPFAYLSPLLDGPGILKPYFAIVGDPAPWSCWRGSFAGTQNWYRLTLDPGVGTTIVVPGLLEAAPLSGMKTETDLRIENGDDPLLISAPLDVGGKPGVRIRTFVPGSNPKLFADRRPGQQFRLRGFTRPALPHRRISFRAEAVLSKRRTKLPKRFRLTTLRTNAKGNFRSKPLKLGNEAIWKITSRLVVPGRFARERNCGPAVNVTSARTSIRD